MAYRDDSIPARLLAGDVEALESVIRWIAIALAVPRFWSMRHEWLDLHQEVLARVIESLRHERYDASRDFRVYVQAVARYTAFEALNARHRDATVQDLDDGVLARSPEQEARSLSAGLARIALSKASDECRNLIKAYFYEQRTYAEIAERMGVPIGTVKSRLSRCLAAIHRVLRGRRVGPGATSNR